MESHDALIDFTVDNDFVNQWFDSLDPSFRTFAIDFAVNKLKRHDYDPDLIEDGEDKYLANLLANHFDAYLRLKIMDSCPGRVVDSWATLPSP